MNTTEFTDSEFQELSNTELQAIDGGGLCDAARAAWEVTKILAVVAALKLAECMRR